MSEFLYFIFQFLFYTPPAVEYSVAWAQWVALGFTALSGVLTANAQRKQGQAQRRAAERDAAAGRRRAAEVLRRADESAFDLVRDTDTFIGAQRSQIAGSGADLGTTTSLALLADTHRKSEEERIRILEEAEYQAGELEIGAQASIEQGRSFERAGNINAIGTGIATFGQAFSIIERGKKPPPKEEEDKGDKK